MGRSLDEDGCELMKMTGEDEDGCELMKMTGDDEDDCATLTTASEI
jgi:hypothetical protein